MKNILYMILNESNGAKIVNIIKEFHLQRTQNAVEAFSVIQNAHAQRNVKTEIEKRNREKEWQRENQFWNVNIPCQTSDDKNEQPCLVPNA